MIKRLAAFDLNCLGNMNEIERKFLVRVLPDLPILRGYISERFLLPSDEASEARITRIGDEYFYEQKHVLSDTERTRSKQKITKHRFNKLRDQATGKLVRETLVISEEPKVVIQMYKGQYTGLMRAEVEFANQAEASSFESYEWMGAEITGLRIARDATLVTLSREEILAQIEALS